MFKNIKNKLIALSAMGAAVASHAAETDVGGSGESASTIIQNGLADVDLGSVATSALSLAAVGLGVWVGWRLACKLLNRGVGK